MAEHIVSCATGCPDDNGDAIEPTTEYFALFVPRYWGIENAIEAACIGLLTDKQFNAFTVLIQSVLEQKKSEVFIEFVSRKEIPPNSTKELLLNALLCRKSIQELEECIKVANLVRGGCDCDNQIATSIDLPLITPEIDDATVGVKAVTKQANKPKRIAGQPQKRKRESKYEPLVQSVLDALEENGEYEKLADLSPGDVAVQIQPSFPNATIDSIARQVRKTSSWKNHKATCMDGSDRPTFQNRQRPVRRNGKPEWKDVD